MPPSQRNTDYGYLPWHRLEPGEALRVPRTYNALATKLNHRFPGRNYSLHRDSTNPDLSILRRNI